MSNNSSWWCPTLRYSSRSDLGMRRVSNQDFLTAIPAASPRIWARRGHLFIVADGMGAHAAGELASRMAVETISSFYLKRKELASQALKSSVLEAHRTIRQKGESEPAFHGMGTTLDSLALLPVGAIIAHVGDSRVYRMRSGILEQLTFDHSLVWELHRETGIAFSNMPKGIPKNVITRSLGPTEQLEVDLEGPYPLISGDIFLLCSDGLSGQVDDNEIGQILSVLSPEAAADFFVNLANLRGGPDNITVQIIQVLNEMTLTPDALKPSPEEKQPISVAAWGSLTTMFLFVALFVWLLTDVKSVFESVKNPAGLLGTLRFFSLLFASIFSGLFIFLARKRLFPPPVIETSTSPLGHGPYSRSSAKPTPEFAGKMLNLLTELQAAALKSGVVRDWQPVDRHSKAAQTAFDQRHPDDALRESVLAINLLMKLLKEKPQQDS